jgi:glycosyltransferase involved in cell wall biosynthesis
MRSKKDCNILLLQSSTMCADSRKTSVASNRSPLSNTQMKVSVLLQTYNHEKWVSQAIESVLIQETNFDFELVILEDCSTDSTRDIVIDYQRRYPEHIRLFLSEENRGDNKALVTAWQTSPSQYIAWLDGDDYWTSPQKLKKQADFLDAHPDCAICFHNVTMLYEDGGQSFWWYPKHSIAGKKFFTLEDLWEGNFIPGCSPMFRKGLITEFPEWLYSEIPSIDWAFYILMAQHGKIGYIDELMGVYRRHREGIWSSINTTQQVERVIEFYRNMDHRLNFRYKDTINTMISRQYRKLELQGSGLNQVLATLNDNELVQIIRGIARRALPMRVRHWMWALWRLQHRA